MARGGVRRGSVVLAIEDIEDHFKDQIDEVRRIAHDIVEEATLLGEDRMIEILESAITTTGLQRAERGGHPGRIDSGQMRDDISSSIDQKGPDTVEGTWGWIDALLEYYLLQEYGDEAFGVKFQGMKALQGSYIEAREALLHRLQQAGFKVN